MEKIFKKIKESPFGYFILEFRYFILEFHIVWLVFAILLIAGLLAAMGCWSIAKWIYCVIIAVFWLFFWYKPMNAVYSLIGTSGSIRFFFGLLIICNFLFSYIYYWGFFSNAGISYDINQPYVSYGMFKDTPRDSSTVSFTLSNIVKGTTTESKSYYISQKQSNTGKIQNDTIVFISPSVPTEHYFYEEHRYNKITWHTVFQNTLLTSLMQEPSDLFSCCSVYNNINSPQEQNLNGFNDEESCRFFTWILLVQVFISWIFFGVFISILYNKFRYES